MLKEVELEQYDMHTDGSLYIVEKGTEVVVCTFGLGTSKDVDQKRLKYAKNFVKTHNATCVNGG